MRFAVVWSQAALNQLADAWNRASNRTAVSVAANHVDVLLRDDPDLQGLDFFGERFLVVGPLRVLFSIDPDDRIVEVREIMA